MRVRRRSGLTLAELVVVLAILIALAGIVVPLVGESAEDARVVVTRANLAMVRDVILGQYRSDMKEVVLAPYRGRLDSVIRPNVLPRPGIRGLAGNRRNWPQLNYLFVNPGNYLDTGAPDLFGETREPSYNPITRIGWRGPYILSDAAKSPQQSFGVYQVTGDKSSEFTRDYGETGDWAVMDGWNRPIVITKNTGKSRFELRSAGPDGKLNLLEDGSLPIDDIVLFLEVTRE